MTVRRLNDGSHDILAQPGMRNTENHCDRHSRLRQQPLLYLERRDEFWRTIDLKSGLTDPAGRVPPPAEKS